MKTNHVGQQIYDTQDLIDLVMSGTRLAEISDLVVGADVDIKNLTEAMTDCASLRTWQLPVPESVTVDQFDQEQQCQWKMPGEYQHLDIAEHVLSCCKTDAELQRAGQELLMYQQRGMFDLLRYLKFLVDTMRNNNIVWGVGRGSCVASFVLYKLGVHRVDSLYYDLDPGEFLR